MWCSQQNVQLKSRDFRFRQLVTLFSRSYNRYFHLPQNSIRFVICLNCTRHSLTFYQSFSCRCCVKLYLKYFSFIKSKMSTGRVIIYGGRGALGAKCVSHFKSKDWWVGSIDMNNNTEADLNILVTKDESLEQQENKVLSTVSNALNGQKLDAVICVAGGWAGGNAKKDLIKNSDLMWRQSVWSSLISSSLAASHLKDGGLLTLTGAKAALESTPGMIGYGMAKSAVHHLTKSLGEKNGGLPDNSTVVAILPVTLDTPMNRQWMPKADFSTWTPLEFVAELFLNWTSGKDRPNSGSLVQLVTTNFNTEVIPVV